MKEWSKFWDVESQKENQSIAEIRAWDINSYKWRL